MTTKTETKRIKSFVTAIHYISIIVLAVMNGAIIVLSFALPGIVSFFLGVSSAATTIFISKQFMQINRRKRLFVLVLNAIDRNTYGGLTATLSDNYKSIFDRIIMRKCFIVSGNKEEYKQFKLKILLYRKSLTK